MNLITSVLGGFFKFLAAILDGHYVAASFFFLKISARLGNPWAQNNIGIKYLLGDGVFEDHKRAAEFLCSAAKSHQVEAFMNLAWMYSDGIYFTRDDEKAFFWYAKAVEKGNPVAKYNLALMLYEGRGTQVDKGVAMSLLLEAKIAGVVEAGEAIENMTRSD